MRHPPVQGSECEEQPVSSLHESRLRHPLEQPVFIASAILNLAILGLAILFIVLGTGWLKAYPRLAKQAGKIEGAAVAVVVMPAALVVLRNTRRGAARAG